MNGYLKLSAGSLALFAAVVGLSGALSVSAQRAEREGEWTHAVGVGGMKYAPLSQITNANVQDLRVVWRWPSADQALQASNPVWLAGRNEETPLLVNGVLYTITGLGLIAALDPGTGQIRLVKLPIPDSQPYGLAINSKGVPFFTQLTGETTDALPPGAASTAT